LVPSVPNGSISVNKDRRMTEGRPGVAPAGTFQWLTNPHLPRV
jgi:hypothetical protein